MTTAGQSGLMGNNFSRLLRGKNTTKPELAILRRSNILAKERPTAKPHAQSINHTVPRWNTHVKFLKLSLAIKMKRFFKLVLAPCESTISASLAQRATSTNTSGTKLNRCKRMDKESKVYMASACETAVGKLFSIWAFIFSWKILYFLMSHRKLQASNFSSRDSWRSRQNDTRTTPSKFSCKALHTRKLEHR